MLLQHLTIYSFPWKTSDHYQKSDISKSRETMREKNDGTFEKYGLINKIHFLFSKPTPKGPRLKKPFFPHALQDICFTSYQHWPRT